MQQPIADELAGSETAALLRGELPEPAQQLSRDHDGIGVVSGSVRHAPQPVAASGAASARGPTRLTPVAPDALELHGVRGMARRAGMLAAQDLRRSRAPVNFSVKRDARYARPTAPQPHRNGAAPGGGAAYRAAC